MAGETEEGFIGEEEVLMSNEESAELAEPGVGAFDNPAALVASALPAVLVAPELTTTPTRPGHRAINVFDLTFRYTTKVLNKETTWRVGGNNLSNVHYWSTIALGNITGTDIGSDTAFIIACLAYLSCI